MHFIRHPLALLLCACSLGAAAQTLQNGGFESAAVADGTGAYGVAASWGGGLVINPDAAGNAFVSPITYTDLPQPFSGEQYANLGDWLSPGVEQTFTVVEPGRYAVTWADNSRLFPDLTATALYLVSFSQGTQTFASTFDAYHQGEWREHQTSAVLTPGTWTLRFASTRVTSGITVAPLIDDVRISPVPEPAVASLLALGLAGLAWRRRRAPSAA